jgi:ferric-dicitrate binding protein FerR (iron transport regulator)
VAFSGESREVYLEGEAYFDVTRSGRPFRVHARGVTVEVLGTSFNVMGYAGEESVQATLVSGRVRVSVDGEPSGGVELLPGQQSRVDTSGVITVVAVDPHAYTSWKENLLVFDDEPLEAIARKLSRWYDVEITIESPASRATLFYGVVPKYASISIFLEMMKKVYAMEYAIKGRRIIIK